MPVNRWRLCSWQIHQFIRLRSTRRIAETLGSGRRQPIVGRGRNVWRTSRRTRGGKYPSPGADLFENFTRRPPVKNGR